MNSAELNGAFDYLRDLIKEDKDPQLIKDKLLGYTPDQQREILNKNIPDYGTLLNKAVRKQDIPIVSYFIEKGADVNIVYYIDEDNGRLILTALIDSIKDNNLELVKLLVDHGATLTMPDEWGCSVLEIVENIDILKYLIEKGANIDDKNHDQDTPLNYHTENLETPIEFLKELLKAGADPNTVNAYIVAPLDKLVLGRQHGGNLEKIKLLVSYGAEITDSIQDKIDEGELSPEIIAALNTTNKKPSKPWKGWTKSDATALDEVFNNPSNFSVCPVCLKHSHRQDGCMYMSHVCTELGGLYNKTLYRMYKNDEGKIYWCTLCNRICLGHRHYKLSIPETKAQLGQGGDPFATDCRPNGGGYPEKVQRFRRLREYALDLNNTEIDEETAFDELTEEFWKAPLRREKGVINTLVAKKAWPNTNKFPENRRPNNTNEANAPNIPAPATLVMPTLSEKGFNSISMNDDIPVLQFHHETTGGIDHKDSLIGVATLQNFLVEKLKNFGTEEFGFCIQYPECKARLYPAEIQPHVSDELYKDYKKKFNAKFKNRSGGAKVNFFGEASNAKCVVKGGRRKTRKARNARKTRRARKARKTRRKISKKSKKSRRHK